MNNEHNIRDLDLLYFDSSKLLNEIMTNSLDQDILNAIVAGISKIEECWQGEDANAQLHKIVSIYNSLVEVRNYIGNTSVFLSTLASSYREAQISNGAALDNFTLLQYTEMNKMEENIHKSSTVYISNDLLDVCTLFNEIAGKISKLNTSIHDTSESIFSNWIIGDDNRNYAIDLFKMISTNLTNVEEQLSEMSGVIQKAVQNYKASLSKVSSIPSLSSMNQKTEMQTSVVEEHEMISHIENNLKENRTVSADFNNQLIEEVKKVLVKEGIL